MKFGSDYPKRTLGDVLRGKSSSWLFVSATLMLALAVAVPYMTTRTGKVTSPIVHEPAIQPIGLGALGRVEPASRVRKLSHAGGTNVSRLGTVLVHEGEQVRTGQCLAELSDLPQKAAAVTQAEAMVGEAEATLARVRAAARPEEIAAQLAHVDALRAVEAGLVRDAARSDLLGPTGATSPQNVDRNRFAAMRATAERAEAEAVLARLRTPWAADIRVAEAKLATALAAAAQARADAELSRIVAPIDGTILQIHARPGEQVGDEGVLDIGDLSQIDVVAEGYESDLPRLRVGAAAEVVVPGDPERYAATVREIGWMVRRTTQADTDPVAVTDARTVEVRLALDAPGRAALRHRTNMQVQVAIRP
jgi:HlyD family secretion protein